MQERKIKFKITENSGGRTLESFLRTDCKVSAGLLRTLKRQENGLLRNGEHIRSIDTILPGDEITLTMPLEKSDILPVCMNIKVIFEDDHILVLDKPPFMPVHPVHEYYDNTLANFVAFHMEQRSEQFVMRFINRLDRNTSGLVLVAKNAYCAPLLQKNVYKEYTAACQGCFKEDMVIDLPIRLKEGHFIEREVGIGGKESITHCKVLKHLKTGHTLLRLVLETGRTHQIRVHLSHIGFPLAGDDLYGGSLDIINRQALHCSLMKFIHPITKKETTVTSALPIDIQMLAGE